MTQDAEPFRLTLNKPAANQPHIRGSAALQVMVRDTIVRIRGVASTEDADRHFALLARDRGGLGAVLSGPVAAEVYDALMRLSEGGQNPFFTLAASSLAGWYDLELTTSRPSRHLPAIRLWPRGSVVVDDQTSEDAAEPAWASKVREAHAVVARWSNRPGRPSRELIDAQETMAAFRRLASDVLAVTNVVAIQQDIDRIRHTLVSMEETLAGRWQR